MNKYVVPAVAGAAAVALGSFVWWWTPKPKPPPPPPVPATVVVDVKAALPDLKLKTVDTVVFSGLSPLQSVVELSSAGCVEPLSYSVGQMTGPPRYGVSGLFARAEVNGPVGADVWTWPELSGVLFVVDWKRVNTAPGVYNWSAIDAVASAASANAKTFILAFRTGIYGTPAWALEPPVRAVNVQEYNDAEPVVGDCGPAGRVGGPGDQPYLDHWQTFLRAAGSHVQSRGDWYQALVQVKVGGLGMISDEAKIARSCNAGCPCNAKTWADWGYTPEKLHGFYDATNAALTAAFPGKSIAYMLIQDGYPRVLSASNWGNYPGGGDGITTDDIAGAVQTKENLRRGAASLGPLWMTYHNGLRPEQRPNNLVIEAGARGELTGLQTVNEKTGVATWQDIEGALSVALEQSDAIAIELYESVWRQARVAWGSDKTLLDYSADLQLIRKGFPADPSPSTWSYKLTEPGTRYFTVSPTLQPCDVGSVTITK